MRAACLRRTYTVRCRPSRTQIHRVYQSRSKPGVSCSMFRSALRLSLSAARSITQARPQNIAPLASRCYSHSKQETDEEFDARWVTYFNKPDIDAWELRKGMNTLIGYDLVPEPKILEAALRACRRLNDLGSAIRILEAVKHFNYHNLVIVTKQVHTKKSIHILSKSFVPRLTSWEFPHLRSLALTKHRLLHESSERPLPWSGLNGPPVLEVFATCHDICVVFNWPV
ncbi:hypothetical protein QTP70_017764 [Hemibagrus guttatus]|uniref:Cytochrome c oxidase subunit 5A, mitochondrial n=1 Tax=Hemibagrus guttatus TaxID=175788 RepID=A0AAE0UZW1_9TELE|nr:hypothetical protein QTP70_017764 [Hemibagrus guttatus]KAK3558426.1 hypothetical protein QTP86_018029 [Hemibagrus guttatus]